ncbi:unnamed protein product, partial [Ilex paraguariensis]
INSSNPAARTTQKPLAICTTTAIYIPPPPPLELTTPSLPSPPPPPPLPSFPLCLPPPIELFSPSLNKLSKLNIHQNVKIESRKLRLSGFVRLRNTELDNPKGSGSGDGGLDVGGLKTSSAAQDK